MAGLRSTGGGAKSKVAEVIPLLLLIMVSGDPALEFEGVFPVPYVVGSLKKPLFDLTLPP